LSGAAQIGSPSVEGGSAGTFGECRDCERRHGLPVGNARALALEMMDEFESIRRLDYRVAEKEADPRLSLAKLFSGGRGNMFGVLECEDRHGETVVLRAFSSLWEGIRQIEGWVLPILDVGVYEDVILPAQDEIKSMTAEMADLEANSRAWAEVQSERKKVSQALWEKMCAAYRFRNFRGEERALSDAILPGRPITGGMGECCAPKLLNHAARNGLRPLGLAEFYWGDAGQGEGRVASRVVGEFYPSCEARCRPILGFMLCGLDD
jgi:hypothetical protein